MKNARSHLKKLFIFDVINFSSFVLSPPTLRNFVSPSKFTFSPENALHCVYVNSMKITPSTESVKGAKGRIMLRRFPETHERHMVGLPRTT